MVEYIVKRQVAPYSLEVRAVEAHWEILCPQGPLAQFLLNMSGAPAPTRTEFRSGQTYIIIPLTPELDQAITQIIQTLIDLRYRTGRVQLELWGNL